MSIEPLTHLGSFVAPASRKSIPQQYLLLPELIALATTG